MKVFAAHTLQGDIDHFVVVPSDAPPGAVAVPSGHAISVSEVDAQSLRLDASKADGLDKLVEAVRGYRVSVKGRGELVRKA